MTDVAVTAASYSAELDPARAQRVYKWLLKQCAQLGLQPTHIAASRAGRYGSFKEFDRSSKRLQSADWNEIIGFALKTMRPDRDFENRGFFDWSMESNIRRDVLLPDHWKCDWSVFPSDFNIDDDAVVESFLEFAKRTVDRYGHVFHMTRGAGPTGYVGGLGASTAGRTDDERNNVGAWGLRTEHLDHFLLRDVYPYNFLTRPYLDLRVEGTTLQKWIMSDDSRGMLEPLTDKVTNWRPVVENIPAIREQLFRAGVIFYWRHFDPFDPMYRDFSTPWEPPDEVPEMLRAEFYKDKDPLITR